MVKKRGDIMDKSNIDNELIISNYNKYHYFINKSIEALEHKYFEEARAYIINAISIDYNAPEAHNLLGALSELKGDLSYAGKHYLAANALDPTYLPAIRNLRRLTTYSFRKKPINPDYGLNNNIDDKE